MSCKTNPSCYSIAGDSFDLSNLDDLAAIQTYDFLNKWFLPLVILARFNAGFFFSLGQIFVHLETKTKSSETHTKDFCEKSIKVTIC
jgi:hypothetical protein